MRVFHPFPSLLDAIATAAIAHLAGGTPSVVARLALSMVLIQFAIGTSNDTLDRDADILRPEKPVAAGLVGANRAWTLAATCGGTGLLVAATVSMPALALGVLGLATGLAYNLRLNRTAWSWGPFAAGVGILPVFALWGATGRFRPEYVAIFALALVGGCSLAVANAITDLAEDRAAGITTVASALGPMRALFVNAVSLVSVQALAIASSAAVLRGWPSIPIEAAFAAGAVVSWAGFGVTALRRPRPVGGWETQAIGLAITGVAWLAALFGSAAL